MNPYEIKTTKHLPDHDRILGLLLAYFQDKPGVIGCYLSGSTATGGMDEDSDLDIGVLCRTSEERELIWGDRWDWEIAPWFHRFDADHIKPHFVIYLYEPAVKADINLYIQPELPPIEGGPYQIIWDDIGVLADWQKRISNDFPKPPDWSSVVHEDERFWAWMFYCATHVNRGENYHVAQEYPYVREVVESWTARLAGYAHLNPRRLERMDFAQHLLAVDLFPNRENESLKSSMMNLIEVQRTLRDQIGDQFGVKWNTTNYAIEKIMEMVLQLN